MHMHFETKIIQHYHRMFVLFSENWKDRIYTTMSSFFLCCKTKTVIWQAGKNKITIIYCLLRKKYIAKNEHTLFYETLFFVMNEKPM